MRRCFFATVVTADGTGDGIGKRHHVLLAGPRQNAGPVRAVEIGDRASTRHPFIHLNLANRFDDAAPGRTSLSSVRYRRATDYRTAHPFRGALHRRQRDSRPFDGDLAAVT
jgi:hypothetical protein